MSEWKKVKLGDILQVKKGEYITKKEAHDGIYPVILGGKEPAYYIDKYNHTGKAIVISRSGASAGYVSFWNEPIFVTDGFLIEPKDTLTYEFLYYALKSKQSLLHNAQKGAAIPHVTPSLIGDIDFFLPSADTQHRIATILSRYDSLIENYQKQIELLEEAAQRLYKEWFVDLHFSGHENTNIVDGVPEGWEKKKVDSIYSIKYGKNLSTKLITETGLFPVYGANGVIGYYDKANCNEQVVLITSRGNGSGDVLVTYHKDSFITNNSFVVTPLEGYEYCKLPFTFQFLKMANFRAVRTGAAQPQLTNQSIHTVDVVLPNRCLIEKYCAATGRMNDAIIKYREQLRLLTEARDRLLPKLMSGEITV